MKTKLIKRIGGALLYSVGLGFTGVIVMLVFVPIAQVCFFLKTGHLIDVRYEAQQILSGGAVGCVFGFVCGLFGDNKYPKNPKKLF